MEKTVFSPKVSVLVPCYNVERFLPQCLDSLVAQTLKELQIICINDGSTDNTLQILKEYAARDSRVEIIDKKNSGYGASMNCGLDAAYGEYIGIVESDDFADKRMFKKLYAFAAKHDCDLVKSNYCEYADGKSHALKPFKGFAYKRVFDPVDTPDVLRVIPIIWAGLYRRQMLIDYDLRFNETPGASFQDTSFVQRVWFAAKRAALLPGSYLNYRIDNAASSVKSTSKVYEICEEFAASEDFLEKYPEKQRVFAPMLNAVKMATYRWNYDRIAEECRRDFCHKWAEEFSAAQSEDLLDECLFDRLHWQELMDLLDDPDSFCERHMQGFSW